MIYMIIIPILSFLFDALLVHLNTRNLQKHQNSVDKETVSYISKKSKYKLIYIFIRQLLLVFFILYLVKDLSRVIVNIDNTTIGVLISVFILFTIIQLITSLYEYYDTFKIEQQFGFNKFTVKGFIKEQLIDYLSTSLIILVVTFIIYFLYENLGISFVLYSLLFILLLLFLFSVFFVVVFMPLLFKETPLENGPLKDKILNLASKEKFNIDKIVIINASSKTTKINAYFSGLGKQKKIMLFDTLLDKFTDEELLAIIAHEMGHSKYRHMLQDMLVDMLLASLYFGIFYLFLQELLFEITGNLFFISLVYTLVSVEFIHKLLKGLKNFLLRKHEKQADLYVVKLGFGKELIHALEVASVTNKGNPYPHPMFVLFKYDHPSSSERIKYIQKEL